MAKKKRFCQYPDCNKPIWHKGSSDYTTGNYCKEHRKPEYQKEIKNKADAERQRLKRKQNKRRTKRRSKRKLKRRN